MYRAIFTPRPPPPPPFMAPLRVPTTKQISTVGALVSLESGVAVGGEVPPVGTPPKNKKQKCLRADAAGVLHHLGHTSAHLDFDRSQVQPILDRFRPRHFGRLQLTRLSLGTRAPRIASARVQKTVGAHAAQEGGAGGPHYGAGVALDLEISWASDLEVDLVMTWHIRLVTLTTKGNRLLPRPRGGHGSGSVSWSRHRLSTLTQSK